MKPRIDNLDALFEEARFDVKDDGFSKRIMSKLPFVERIDKWKVFKDVASQVAVVAGIVAMVCFYAYSRFDYDVFNERMMGTVEKFNEKTIDFSEKVVNLDRVANNTISGTSKPIEKSDVE